jgi:DNA-binding transcriptional LysR family regulator
MFRNLIGSIKLSNRLKRFLLLPEAIKPIPSPREVSYLLAPLEHGNLGRAAAALFVSQPAFPVGIAKLERVLEASLVKCSKRHVRFIVLGEEIVVHAPAK